MPIYLDNAATTRMLPAALDAFTRQATSVGNPSSVHSAGQTARAAVEQSRVAIAQCVNADPIEVVFTSGGTEAINLAVKGLFWQRKAEDSAHNVIVVPEGEHHATLDSIEWLQDEQGAEVVWLPLDRHGTVKLDAVAQALTLHHGRIALLSMIWVNNEVGTIQPAHEVAALAAERGVPVHLDAVAGFGQLPLDFRALGVAAVSLSSHKIGGPVAAGALLLDRRYRPQALLHGGGQERKVRSGTVDAAGTAAFAAAVAEVYGGLENHQRHLIWLRDRLIAGVQRVVPEAQLMGHPTERAPGNAHFVFEGCEGDSLLFLLDAEGIQASTGSACTAGVPQPSHVLLAMGCTEAQARGALRFTLGHDSTVADVDALIAALPGVVARARAAGMADHEPVGF